MRQLMPAGLLAAVLAAFVPGLPLGPLSGTAAAQDAPAVIVNDEVITAYELEQRLRFMQALGAPGTTAEAAETALINERLQLQEARRMGISPGEQAIQAGMTEFAGRAGLDSMSFIGQLAQAGVDATTFRDFIRAGVVWREILRVRVAPGVVVSDRQVAQARQRAIETPRVTQVLISELIIPAPPGTEERIAAQAAQIAASVSSEAEFAAAARQYSATPSAPQGGRLDWTRVDNLPQGLAPILLALQPGQVTQPLSIPGAVVLFYLRDTRGEVRPGATAETVEFLRLMVASTAEAAQVQAEADTCGTFYVAARGRPVEHQVADTSAIPAETALVLSRLDPNEIAAIPRGGAVEVLMLCERAPTLLAEGMGENPIPGLPQPVIAGGAPTVAELPEAPDGFDPVPTAGEAREAVFTAEVNRAAETLLAELRANAIIIRP
ncbi:peptidylprolyl isomerase [Paracoccus sp. S-4012]|uniref:peptidylprolyl isomerase n=1 Tax=Paracoccus sp. S-4012 TaxID=2665648 RepID=UPI0012AFE717|nr:peptidylprolyl isomerase [Paracoccus sp. S-4012]MRX51065.1 peptidylprolyl isomerase [Paracoccus sp. S-4012]